MKDLENKVERIASGAALAFYIGYWFVMAMMQIGEPPKMGTETKWWFPFVILIVVGMPAFFGYKLGQAMGKSTTHGDSK